MAWPLHLRLGARPLMLIVRRLHCLRKLVQPFSVALNREDYNHEKISNFRFSDFVVCIVVSLLWTKEKE